MYENVLTAEKRQVDEVIRGWRERVLRRERLGRWHVLHRSLIQAAELWPVQLRAKLRKEATIRVAMQVKARYQFGAPPLEIIEDWFRVASPTNEQIEKVFYEAVRD